VKLSLRWLPETIEDPIKVVAVLLIVSVLLWGYFGIRAEDAARDKCDGIDGGVYIREAGRCVQGVP